MPEFLEVYKSFVLQYILEPNKLIYYLYNDCNKLTCTESKLDATRYFIRDNAVREQDRINNMFGLEFQIVEL